jgi:quercetin dioxygenase-like cupin family protein
MFILISMKGRIRMQGEVHDPARRQRYIFRTTSPETGGRLLEVEVWAAPGGDVPRHVHPHQEERFEVLAGSMTFDVGGSKRRAAAGDRLVVPPGTPHAFVNDGDDEAHLMVEIRPALDLQEFLEAAAGLSRARKITPGGVPRGPRALLEVAILAGHFREATYLTRPPLIVQRVTTTVLSALGHLFGMRAPAIVDAARKVP